MSKKVPKLLVNDIYDDLREENNRLLIKIFDFINKFSIVFNKNNNKTLNLNQLNSDFRKFRLNQNYLEKYINYFVNRFNSNEIIGQKSGLKSGVKRGRPQKKIKISSNKRLKSTNFENKESINDLLVKCNNVREELDQTYDQILNKSIHRKPKQLSEKSLNFKCNECKQLFDSRLNLSLHVNRDHKNVESFVCHECKQLFDSKQLFLTHLSLKHKNPVYKCDLCLYKTSYKQNLVSHKASHSTDRPFKCDFEDCIKSYKTVNSLNQHKKSHNKEKEFVFVCDFLDCKQTFDNKFSLRRHKTSHTNGKPFNYYKKMPFKQKFINQTLGSALNPIAKYKEMGQKISNISKLMANQQKKNLSETNSHVVSPPKFTLITELIQNGNNDSNNLNDANVVRVWPQSAQVFDANSGVIEDNVCEIITSNNNIDSDLMESIDPIDDQQMRQNEETIPESINNNSFDLNSSPTLPESHANVSNKSLVSDKTTEIRISSENNFIEENICESNESDLNENNDKTGEELDERVERESDELPETTKTDTNEPNVIPLCDECGECFETELELEMHLNSIHKTNEPPVPAITDTKVRENTNRNKNLSINSKPIHCIKCKIDFKSKELFTKHICKGQQKERQEVKCNVCKERFMSSEELETHMKSWKREDNVLKCRECHLMFKSDRQLVLHNYTVHKQYFYKCIYCEFITQNTQDFVKHDKTHENQTKISSNSSSYFCSNDLSFNKDINTNSIEKITENETQNESPSVESIENSLSNDKNISITESQLNESQNTGKNNETNREFEETVASNESLVNSLSISTKTTESNDKIVLNSEKNNSNIDENMNSIGEQTIESIKSNKSIEVFHKTSTIGGSPNKSKQFSCKKCEKTFDSMTLFLNHTKTHFKSKEIALKCIKCQFITTDLQSLIGHQKTH